MLRDTALEAPHWELMSVSRGYPSGSRGGLREIALGELGRKHWMFVFSDEGGRLYREALLRRGPPGLRGGGGSM